jgi:hypothetical protein
MDALTTILTALTAGAAASAKDTASMAVKDAYSGLKELIKDRFKGNSKAEFVLADYESDPETYEESLIKALSEAQIDQEQSIFRAAQQVLVSIPAQQKAEGKYNLQIAGDVHGMAVGDHQNVTINLGKEPKKK